MANDTYNNSFLNKRNKFEILRAQLRNERQSFLNHWRDITDLIMPRRGRFSQVDNNRGEPRNDKIIDSTATMALRTLRSGLMAGITSPARPWFRLTTRNPTFTENASVKKWLEEVSDRMATVFLKSNLYNVLPIMYGDLGGYGTACMLLEPDAQDVIRCYPFPIGTYYIANDRKLKVNTFCREFRLTVRQLVEQFGRDPRTGKIDWSNISTVARNLYENNQTEAWIELVHFILPNEDFDASKKLGIFKKYVSVYYELGYTGASVANTNYLGGSLDNGKYLRMDGYDMFPVLAPRWEIAAEDIYGTGCPGMTALGDIKQLQVGEKRILQAVEKMINPPMVGPTALQNAKVSILPGDITYLDERDGQASFRSVHEINFNVQAMELKQQQVRERISRSFYEDLFLMLAQSDRRNITATEIEERKEEKLLALGPVLEQLNQDLLDPLIDLTFDIMSKREMIPEPPEEIAGQELKVEYISVMAQAQKLNGLAGVERFSTYFTNLSQFKPDILDKVDSDELIDHYGEVVSMPAGIVRTDEEADEIREARAQAQQAQAQAEQAQAQVQAAESLSNTKLEGDSALDEMLSVAQAGQVV
jgi:hypothetical protein